MGDRVVIVKKVDTAGVYWADLMDKLVGKTGEVIASSVSPRGAPIFRVGQGPDDSAWWFPAESLMFSKEMHARGEPYIQKAAPEVSPKESALASQVGGGHYKSKGIQPVEYIHANGMPFIEGCVVKYISRWRDKGGIADLQKAKHFIDMLIELEEGKTQHG